MRSGRFGIWRGSLLVLLIAGLAFAIACGSEEEGGDAGGEGGGAPPAGQIVEPANKADLAKLKGEIIADGSSTVYPVTQAAAEEFRTYARDVRISVGIAGTGGGFQKFCNGETDIQDASRPISVTEAEACKNKGIEYIELPVAYDGLAVVVSPQNNWAACLTKAELKKVWEPAARGAVTNWNQVRSSFPDAPLRLFGPGTDSGTFDYFTQAINGKEKDSRSDFQASEDDNVLVQGVSTDKNALGYFGYAYYAENKDKLKLVPIDDGNKDNGDGAIAPSPETVANGTYQPLSRPIFLYASTKAIVRPEVDSFITYYLDNARKLSAEVGYVALPEKADELAKERYKARKTGSMFEGGSKVGVTMEQLLAEGAK